jgi:hypothetical protein
VIQRTIDGIFFRGVTPRQTLAKAADFDTILNQAMLSTLKERIAPETTEEILKEVKTIEVGFPSSYWFSDHLPVGAILSFD